MEPKNHPIEKEQNLPILDSISNFPGCMGVASIFRDRVTWHGFFFMFFLDPKFTAKQRHLKLVETLRCGFVLAWGLDLQTERFGQQDILVEFDFPSKTKMTSWKIHRE